MVIWSIIVWQTFKKKRKSGRGRTAFHTTLFETERVDMNWYEFYTVLRIYFSTGVHDDDLCWVCTIKGGFVWTLYVWTTFSLLVVQVHGAAGWFSSIFNDHFKALYARPYEQRFDPGISPSVYRWNTSCMYHFYARIFRLTK